MTIYRMLLNLSGMSLQEAADFHGVRLDTVKSWAAGRNPAPAGALRELRGLVARQRDGAVTALETIRNEGATVVLDISQDDQQAQTRGWPCRSAEAMMYARAIAQLPDHVTVTIKARSGTGR